MTLEANKDVVRRWVDARNRHDLEQALALFAEDLHERLSAAFTATTTAFPDVHITIEELIAEGERVASRWSYHGTHQGPFREIPPTGRAVAWKGIDFYTVRDSRIVDVAREADNLDLLRQLGVAPDAHVGAT